MADITVNNLTKYYGDKLILSDLTFDIKAGEKVAILGENGAGKTTLLNILSKRLDYDNGNVSIIDGKTVGMIDQMPVYPENTTVEDVLKTAFNDIYIVEKQMKEIEKQMEKEPENSDLLKKYDRCQQKIDAMGGYNKDFEIDKVCNGLEISQSQRKQYFCKLSGGEKTRINLARIILEQTDILLLDEPTNHLDMDAVNWLGNYFENYCGTIITVSHDRYFLDQCCDRIIEVKDCKIEFYAGSYSFYAVERERRYEQRLKEHENQMAEIKRLEAVSRLMHERGTELLAKRAASIDKRIARMKVTDRPKKEKSIHVSFGDVNYETEDVLKVRDIKKSYGNRIILNNLTFNIRNGEKVAILGDNGAGKTTLLKIILGEEKADDGTVKKGVGLRPAYLPQNVYFSNENRNLIDTLIYDKNITMQTARNRLGAFKFSGEEQLKIVKTLSGGEKSRLRLCELMYDNLNMLILDEPTNHLDLSSREWIEDAVEAFMGTLIFVSHDRYFVERFATRIIYLENGSYIDYSGNYSDFLNYRERLKEAKPVLRSETKPKKEKSKQKGGTKNISKRLNILERDIEKLETEQKDIDNMINEIAADHQKLMEILKQKEEIEIKLLDKMQEWEMLSEELEK